MRSVVTLVVLLFLAVVFLVAGSLALLTFTAIASPVILASTVLLMLALGAGIVRGLRYRERPTTTYW